MRIFIAALMLGTVATQPAFAWREEGHSIIAEIAQRRLSDEAQAGIAATIGAGASLASIANWADDERLVDKTTYRWHFVNPPRGAAEYDAARDCPTVEGQGDCLIAALGRQLSRVACASETAESRQRALKFIVHLVGDLHQPLHAIGEARGANDVTVIVDMREGAEPGPPFPSNLHEVWDKVLPQSIARSWGAYVDRIEDGILPGADSTALTAGTVADWLLESHRTGLEIFDATATGSTIGDQYRIEMTPIVDRQLLLGGLRLAKVLDEAYAAKQCAS